MDYFACMSLPVINTDVVSVNFLPVTPEDKHIISILADGNDAFLLTFFDHLIPGTSQIKINCGSKYDT